MFFWSLTIDQNKWCSLVDVKKSRLAPVTQPLNCFNLLRVLSNKGWWYNASLTVRVSWWFVLLHTCMLSNTHHTLCWGFVSPVRKTWVIKTRARFALDLWRRWKRSAPPQIRSAHRGVGGGAALTSENSFANELCWDWTSLALTNFSSLPRNASTCALSAEQQRVPYAPSRLHMGWLREKAPRPDGSVPRCKLLLGPNPAALLGMIVSNVNLSCARCPGEGVVATAAATTDAYDELSGSLPPPSLSPTGHLVVAVCLGFIGTSGFFSNFLVLALFCRYRALRTPMNLLLVSISASDLMVSVLGTPFSFAASTQGRWLIGRTGCVWYGFVNACLGKRMFSLHLS